MDALASFGPYSLLRAIAETRDSVSFAARFEGQRDKPHVLAIKVMRPQMLQVPGLPDALVEEMGLAVRLNHVNVAQVFDCGRAGDHAYIALEFVDGIPLSMVHDAVAPGQKAVTTEVAAFVCAEACAGLAYAHGRRDEKGNVLGIVHSRVSPRTVLLSKSGLVKVVDFGLARTLTSHAPEVTDNADLSFLAPEVVRGEDFDQRADIFSIGAIAHLLLTGRTIYGNAVGEELETKARRGYVPAVLDTDDSVPEPLAELVDKALSPDPAERFEDATELRSGLAAWLRRNAPGFGRHRLKNYLTRLLPQATYGLFPDTDWEPLHRKNFRFLDPDSLITESVEFDADLPTSKDAIEPLLDDPEVPRMRRLDLAAMDTGAHKMVREQAFAAARARGNTVPQQRVTTGTRARVVRTPPPMPAVNEEIFASRSYESGGQSVAASGTASTDDELDSISGEQSPFESSGEQTPAPRAAQARPAADDDFDFDAPPPVDATVDAPGEVQIDPAYVYDDTIDPALQRAAVAESEVDVAPVRPTGTIIGVILGLALLAVGGYFVKDAIDQRAEAVVTAPQQAMVFVTSRPQGARILLDGNDTGLTTPAPLRSLPSSAAQVTVSLAGFDTPSALTLDPNAPPPQLAFELEPTEHRIRIDSDPSGALVLMDGQSVGTTPAVIGPMRVDYRRGVDLVLRLDGYLDEHVSVDWAAGETESSVRRPLHVDPDYVPPTPEP